MKIVDYDFTGPYPLGLTTFYSVGAVYFITDDFVTCIDVGQTDDLKDRLAKHERRDCWRQSARGRIIVYAFVDNSERNRLIIESRIRSSYSFKCGDK